MSQPRPMPDHLDALQKIAEEGIALAAPKMEYRMDPEVARLHAALCEDLLERVKAVRGCCACGGTGRWKPHPEDMACPICREERDRLRKLAERLEGK